MESSLIEASNILKSKYGKHCRIIKDQGDYKLIVKVQFENKIILHIAVPSTTNHTHDHLEILINGCKDNDFRTQLEQKLYSCMEVVPIDQLFIIADQFINENTPQQSISDQSDLLENSAHIPRKMNSNQKLDKKSENIQSKSTMKTAFEVISRLRWDERLMPLSEHISVGYLDRFTGIIEKPFSEFNWTDDFVDVDMEADFSVPQHRIQYFKYKNAVVWDKRDRFDAVFNSGRSHVSLEDIIKKEDMTV